MAESNEAQAKKQINTEYLKERKRRKAVDRFRLIMMILAVIYTLGVTPSANGLMTALTGFCVPTFFIFSGYFVLHNDEDRSKRILRTIKRTGIAFIALSLVIFVVNMLMMGDLFFEKIASSRFWFDLLVLNKWDLLVGYSMWYLQALLYAYIIIFVIEKIGLLKYDWLIALACLAFGAIFGEFAGVTGLTIFGEKYLVGSFITRGLPYILIGSYIHRNMKKLSRLHRWQIVCIALAGLAMSVGELYLLTGIGILVYYSHLLGMGVTAFALCLFILRRKEKDYQSMFSENICRYGANIMFYLNQFVYIAVYLIISKFREKPDPIYGYVSVIVCAISFILAAAIIILSTVIGVNIRRNRAIKEKAKARAMAKQEAKAETEQEAEQENEQTEKENNQDAQN